MMTIRSSSPRNRPARGLRHGGLGAKRRRDRKRRCCAPASPSPATWCGSATSSTTPAAPAQIAIYRAPDLGTTGTLPTAQVLDALRAHQVIGVDTRDIREITVTRLARTLEAKDIELQVAHALEHRNGLGDAANLSLTFDRDVEDLRLEAVEHRRRCRPLAARYDSAHRPLRRHLRHQQRQRHHADAAALHRHGDRNRRGRGADAQRRAQRGDQGLRRRQSSGGRRRKSAATPRPATARSACRRGSRFAPARR